MLKELEVKNFILILWNELGKHIILTIPVFTTTTQIIFCNEDYQNKTAKKKKMEDGYLADNMVIYIDKGISENFSFDLIIDEFRDIKEQKKIF